MAGEGGSRTHLSICMDNLVLKTSRATGPYPLPSERCNDAVLLRLSDCPQPTLVLLTYGDALGIAVLQEGYGVFSRRFGQFTELCNSNNVVFLQIIGKKLDSVFRRISVDKVTISNCYDTTEIK